MEEKRKEIEVRSEQWESDRRRQIFTFKATQLVWLLLGILEGLMTLRLLLKLIAANPNSPIAAFIYAITGLFLIPFHGLTPTPSVSGFVLEIPTMFAMLIYGLLGWAVERFTWLIFYRPRGSMIEVTRTRTREDQSHHQQSSG